MLWSKEQIIELIKMLKAAPALWDIQTKAYKDKNMKFDETEKIASHFKTNSDEIIKKLKSLKTQFFRERRKIKEQNKSGAATKYKKWFGYDVMMKFLGENYISKGCRCTIEENTKRETEYYNDDILSISCTEDEDEDEDEDETSHENYPSINNKSLTSSPVKRASSEVKNKKKIKTNNDIRVVESYNFRRCMQENVKLIDDFSVYGENVARRIRSAKQNGRAISIAKNRIDNILFQLEMGVFLMPEEDKFVTTQNLNLNLNNTNNRYFPEIYTSQATPTHTSDLISVSSSSPYPSPSSVQSQPMHSFHTLQQQNQSTPLLYELETQSENNWQPHTFNTPEPQQLQSQITFQQQNSDIEEIDEYLFRRANYRYNID